MEESKWASRKLIISLLQFVNLVTLPIIYKYFEISEATLLMVLGSTSALASIYLGANVWQKKILAAEEKEAP